MVFLVGEIFSLPNAEVTYQRITSYLIEMAFFQKSASLTTKLRAEGNLFELGDKMRPGAILREIMSQLLLDECFGWTERLRMGVLEYV